MRDKAESLVIVLCFVSYWVSGVLVGYALV